MQNNDRDAGCWEHGHAEVAERASPRSQLPTDPAWSRTPCGSSGLHLCGGWVTVVQGSARGTRVEVRHSYWGTKTETDGTV